MRYFALACDMDDETSQYHLRRHDVSRGFRTTTEDESLAAEADDVEARDDLSPNDSRSRIRAAIQRRYTRGA